MSLKYDSCTFLVILERNTMASDFVQYSRYADIPEPSVIRNKHSFQIFAKREVPLFNAEAFECDDVVRRSARQQKQGGGAAGYRIDRSLVELLRPPSKIQGGGGGGGGGTPAVSPGSFSVGRG